MPLPTAKDRPMSTKSTPSHDQSLDGYEVNILTLVLVSALSIGTILGVYQLVLDRLNQTSAVSCITSNDAWTEGHCWLGRNGFGQDSNR